MRVGNEEDRAAVASLEKLMEIGGGAKATMPERPRTPARDEGILGKLVNQYGLDVEEDERLGK